MSRRLGFAFSIALALWSLAALSSRAGAAVVYHLTDLLPEYISSGASGINDYGQVVGTTLTGLGGAAFVWTPDVPRNIDGSSITLPPLVPNRSTSGFGINSIGQVTGSANVSSGGTHAFVWTPDTPNGSTGTMYDTRPGQSIFGGEIGTAINDYGQLSVLGNSNSVRLWTPSTPNGSTGTLTTLMSGFMRYNNINDYGQVAAPPGLWTPNTPNGTTGSMTAINGPSGNISPSAINVVGQIAGKNFLWTPTTPNGTSGSAIDIGFPAGDGWTDSLALNDYGTVVGSSGPEPGSDNRAFVWNSSDGIHDLNTLLEPGTGAGYVLTEARGINNWGQIVGYALYTPPEGGELTRAFLLTPTTLLPEPGCAAIFVLAAGMGVLRRRR